MKENLHLRIYNRFKPYAKTTDWFMSIKLPFMGGVPLSWVLVFFWRGINRESISMKASGIAFNLFLSLLPALLFLF
ncbi:MAG: hypothetical protein NTX03_08565, partial [Bacteroidetes bacterium]|nr:hypothetical protein [Bacteroidota bacterium]